jgi:hypothetical protein
MNGTVNQRARRVVKQLAMFRDRYQAKEFECVPEVLQMAQEDLADLLIVGLYGPTWPERNGPWDPEDVVISRADVCVCHHKRQCLRGAPASTRSPWMKWWLPANGD